MSRFEADWLQVVLHPQQINRFRRALHRSDLSTLCSSLQEGISPDTPMPLERGGEVAPLSWLLLNDRERGLRGVQTRMMRQLIFSGANLTMPDAFMRIPADYACDSENVNGAVHVIVSTILKAYGPPRLDWSYDKALPRLMSQIFGINKRYEALNRFKAVHEAVGEQLDSMVGCDPAFGRYLEETHPFWMSPMGRPDPRSLPYPGEETMGLIREYCADMADMRVYMNKTGFERWTAHEKAKIWEARRKDLAAALECWP